MSKQKDKVLTVEDLQRAVKAFSNRKAHATFTVENPTDEERKIIGRIQELSKP